MAESLSHKFGQIIGDLLELAIEPHLRKFAKKNKLFLDKNGPRKARSGKKVTWTDGNGNKHDLDFVLERGGTENKIGIPVAFIESAWRRYAKHSRNKAQEIQGAIKPLSDKYQNSSPFIGVILAGVFTKDALKQLKSLEFGVLYFPYETIIKAFKKGKIDAEFDEKTSEQEFKNKIDSWLLLNNKQPIIKELLRLNKPEVEVFFQLLTESVSRFIENVIVLPLYGQKSSLDNVENAIDFIRKYSEENPRLPLIRYEIMIRYNTTDKIEARFENKKDAINFLENYL